MTATDRELADLGEGLSRLDIKVARGPRQTVASMSDGGDRDDLSFRHRRPVDAVGEQVWPDFFDLGLFAVYRRTDERQAVRVGFDRDWATSQQRLRPALFANTIQVDSIF